MASLRVGAVILTPPFNGASDGSGLDVELMTEIGRAIGATVQFIAYRGADCDGILDELAAGNYDCVASGITVTPDRARKVAFTPPYLISGQALAVDTARLPHVTSIDELTGRTIGVQRGSSGHAFAERLIADVRAAGLRTYDYGDLPGALSELSTGGCDGFIALAPVLAAAAAAAAADGVEVVQRRLTTEEIAIAVRRDDHRLLSRVTVALAELEAAGTLQRFRRKWLGNPYTDQHLTAH